MFSLSAAFAFKGEQIPTEPGALFMLAFDHDGKDWRFLNSHDVYFLVDGERMALGEANRTSDVGRGKVRERLTITISAEQFAKIAQRQEGRGEGRHRRVRDKGRAPTSLPRPNQFNYSLTAIKPHRFRYSAPCNRKENPCASL
jgi:hypothetical protein